MTEAMTVEELIRHLQTLPAGSRVYTLDSCDCCTEYEEVSEEQISQVSLRPLNPVNGCKNRPHFEEENAVLIAGSFWVESAKKKAK